MDRARGMDESVFIEREHSSQQCLLPGTSAPCSRNLHACYAQSAAALISAARPGCSGRTMVRSIVVVQRPARFPGSCAGRARIPPQLHHRSFERGFKSGLFLCRVRLDVGSLDMMALRSNLLCTIEPVPERDPCVVNCLSKGPLSSREASCREALSKGEPRHRSQFR